MDLRETQSERLLRLEIAEWLAENVTRFLKIPATTTWGSLTDRFGLRREWQRRLHEARFVAVDWPVEYGGRGLTLNHKLLVHEELTSIEAPLIANWVGVELVGPTVLKWGTPEQKERFLSPILSGDEIWCQAFTEETAGSDLLAVTTQALKKDSSFCLNGRKKWVSWAQFADFALVLARTGPGEVRQRSLTCFVVPTTADGVVIRPIAMSDGDSEENEVLFSDVVIPESNVIGQINEGWRVIRTNLELSRGIGNISRVSALHTTFQQTLRLLEGQKHSHVRQTVDFAHRTDLAEVYAKLLALKYLGYRVLDQVAGDKKDAPSLAPVHKLAWSQLSQIVASLAFDAGGVHSLFEKVDEYAPGTASTWKEFLRSKANTIEGGTTEIQKNSIARELLSSRGYYSRR
jgi:alkylation response protein AidB-like acyl-CoA dehydrogenase